MRRGAWWTPLAHGLGHVVWAASAGTAVLVLWLWVGPLRLIWGLGDLITCKFHPRVSDPRLGHVVSAPWRHAGIVPLKMVARRHAPFHFISLHFKTTVVHCIWDTMMTSVYMLYPYIDNKYFEFQFEGTYLRQIMSSRHRLGRYVLPVWHVMPK